MRLGVISIGFICLAAVLALVLLVAPAPETSALGETIQSIILVTLSLAVVAALAGLYLDEKKWLAAVAGVVAAIAWLLPFALFVLRFTRGNPQ